MKIAIASLGDPRSASTWSGIPSQVVAAMKRKGHEIHAIALALPKEPWYFNWLRRYYHRIFNRWFLGSVEKIWLSKISQQLDREVNTLKPDAVLVIHGDWLAYATFNYPAFIIHDTTFASILNYYPTSSNLSERSVKMGHQMYERALTKATAAVFSAKWATESATRQYGIPQSKLFTIPFGPNIDETPSEEEVLSWMDYRMRSESCELLFMGTQWKRKGGPEALRFVTLLNEIGVPATLTIIGCTPDVPPSIEPYVRKMGYLKKNVAADNAAIKEALMKSHAVVVLSEAECYGCVYCEANAYGLPALGRNTGGVPEIITDGSNGLLQDVGESIEAFAVRWAQTWKNKYRYRQMCIAAYKEFRERLNYDVFAERLDHVLNMFIRSNGKVNSKN